jgi:hypothetical protein
MQKMKQSETTIGDFLRLYARMKEKVSQATPNDLITISVVDETPGITPSKLARKRGVSTPAVTGSVDRLEELGLANRRYGGPDRREIPIYLTAFGTEVMDHINGTPSVTAE